MKIEEIIVYLKQETTKLRSWVGPLDDTAWRASREIKEVCDVLDYLRYKLEALEESNDTQRETTEHTKA